MALIHHGRGCCKLGPSTEILAACQPSRSSFAPSSAMQCSRPWPQCQVRTIARISGCPNVAPWTTSSFTTSHAASVHAAPVRDSNASTRLTRLAAVPPSADIDTFWFGSAPFNSRYRTAARETGVSTSRDALTSSRSMAFHEILLSGLALLAIIARIFKDNSARSSLSERSSTVCFSDSASLVMAFSLASAFSILIWSGCIVWRINCRCRSSSSWRLFSFSDCCTRRFFHSLPVHSMTTSSVSVSNFQSPRWWAA
mmetsp:Transcript_51721/g.117668  ORF Transcript_51721/g.117668 Transcript_51721/m.117668 type:complete len:255 (+) Transcript_51721:700-1464(+)